MKDHQIISLITKITIKKINLLTKLKSKHTNNPKKTRKNLIIISIIKNKNKEDYNINNLNILKNLNMKNLIESKKRKN